MSHSNSENNLTPFQRFTGFLNIEPSETRMIGTLLLFYFVLELAFIQILAVAFGIFIDEFGSQGLPYSYIAIAFFASTAALLYIKLSERVAFSRALTITLSFLTFFTLAVWLALHSHFYHYIAFILPLLYQIVANLGNLIVWQLAGRMFSFPQAKRLFPLLNTAAWLADILAGVLVASLAQLLGSANLLFISVVLMSLAIPLLRHLTQAYLGQESHAISTPHWAANKTKRTASLLKNRYVVLIFTYVILWWVAYFFLDNIFSNRAASQFPDANQLTAFMGQLLSMSGIIAVIFSTFLTGRIIRRFGIRVGLISMPVLVSLAVGGLALSASLGAALTLVFAISALAKLINDALGFTLSISASALVYKSVPDNMRERVQTTAEGIVQPLAIGAAGIALLALTAGLGFDYLKLSFVFLALAVLWILAILLLSGKYVGALTQIITKRRLGDDAGALADPASIALLKDRLHDVHAGVVIYALNRLEALDPHEATSELPGLIGHPAPEVRREAFVRVENLKLKSMLRNVQNQLAVETTPAVKESALRALGAIAEDKSQLTSALNETDSHSLRGALIGLLKYGHEPSAQQKLEELLASTSQEKRNLVMEVMGVVNRREDYSQLISACDSPATSRAAGLALVAIGAEALPEIESAWGESDAPRRCLLTLARVLGRLGGVKSQTILLSRISEPDSEVRSQILNALSHSGYRTKDIALIQRAAKTETQGAAWITATQGDLGDNAETELLQAALTQSHVQIRNRVLLLLSFAFDGDSIRRVREALTVGSSTQVSYALEIMDVQLPTDWKLWIMPLLENLSPQKRSQRLSALFPQIKRDRAERLQEITENKNLPDWVRACAMYAAHEGDSAMLSTVEKVLILKSVAMFNQTPDNVLAEVADLLEEVDISENETIFKKGDTGDSMYVILDGKVRVHDGERLLNYLGERDVFGEMALLDPEPRSASVTAIESTRLFRLDQLPFYDLMEERPEIAKGIIRILSSRLRNRMDDIAQLDARLKALQGGRSA